MGRYKILFHFKKGRISQEDFCSSLEIFSIAVNRFNSKFQEGCKTQNKKFIAGYAVDLVNQTIKITLITEKKIPNRNRAGNCLRELTVQFMKISGSHKYLTPTNLGKLFRSKV